MCVNNENDERGGGGGATAQCSYSYAISSLIEQRGISSKISVVVRNSSNPKIRNASSAGIYIGVASCIVVCIYYEHELVLICCLTGCRV